MCKTKGSRNYFKGGELYLLKESIGYAKTQGVTVPEHWKKEKLHRLAREWGIVPAYDNGVEGLGHHEKYTGKQMYQFSKLLIEKIRDERTPSVLPLEKMAKDAKRTSKKAICDFVDIEPEEVSAPLDSDFVEIADAFIALGEAMKKALGV